MPYFLQASDSSHERCRLFRLYIRGVADDYILSSWEVGHKAESVVMLAVRITLFHSDFTKVCPLLAIQSGRIECFGIGITIPIRGR